MSILDFFNYDNQEKRQRDAEYMFQITEYGGELWLTYNGNLVCPCSMLNGVPVDAVRKIREMYVKRGV